VDDILFIIRSMKNELKRTQKELKETEISFMKHYHSGEINVLERYIEFIEDVTGVSNELE
jgi:hypothetical protein